MARDVLLDPNRLEVLRDLAILDTPAEPDYDDVAVLASVCCGSPIAAVNFVDDERHWTKAIVGVDGGQGASVSGDLSLCAATIRSEDGVLSIPDTQASETWRSHPFVTGPEPLRFYEGAAITVSGEPIGVVCVFGDEPRQLSEQQRDALRALARQASTHLELRKLAITDPLTGLANRTLLFDRLELAIAQRARTGGEVGVLFCDVNGFKLVNDRWGHDSGDRMLCQVAMGLRASVRSTDTVGRLSGDEFVVVCPGLDMRSDLRVVIERIDAYFRELVPSDDVPAPAVAVGGALVREDEGAVSVVGRADTAMYEAKASMSSRPAGDRVATAP